MTGFDMHTVMLMMSFSFSFLFIVSIFFPLSVLSDRAVCF
jgi:hypothetical protein